MFTTDTWRGVCFHYLEYKQFYKPSSDVVSIKISDSMTSQLFTGKSNKCLSTGTTIIATLYANIFVVDVISAEEIQNLLHHYIIG